MVTQMVRTVPETILFKIAMENEGQIKFTNQNVHYIDHDSDYVTEIRHSSPHGVDLVLDCQYEDNFLRDLNLLRPMGKYVLFGTQAAVHRGFFDSARTVSYYYLTNYNVQLGCF
jgi:NADPH:quinone reductase-like Zn-dependent oxidoreductase